ncbi:MAG TPA: hypothetical protein VFP93_03145 [Gammaproteobacteria bacterium]|nr:hypothetical protein [Gammaproteobacteria bacterium]
MFIPNFESNKLELEKNRISSIPDQIRVALIPLLRRNTLEGEQFLASLNLSQPKTRNQK